MRSILISVLLLVAVIILYTNIANGDGGMKHQIKSSGEAVGSYIRQMSP
ncbi:MAG: hypothetical protein ACE3L7_18355 [Candidatus Pristimantibacillus sp.]